MVDFSGLWLLIRSLRSSVRYWEDCSQNSCRSIGDANWDFRNYLLIFFFNYCWSKYYAKKKQIISWQFRLSKNVVFHGRTACLHYLIMFQNNESMVPAVRKLESWKILVAKDMTKYLLTSKKSSAHLILQSFLIVITCNLWIISSNEGLSAVPSYINTSEYHRRRLGCTSYTTTSSFVPSERLKVLQLWRIWCSIRLW